jgi:sigma-B regulation protein RsbU (phosphoserine phosphatase)
VSEALNAAEEEFGEARVQAEVERSAGAGPSALVERITAGVRTFIDGATPNDDLTVMVIQYGAASGAAPPP